MGEESASVLAPVHETTGYPLDGAPGGARKWRPTPRTVAGLVVAALVIAGGTVGGVAWANSIAHDNAIAEAETARAAAARAFAAHRATLVWLETSVDAGIALHDTVTTGVLAQQDFLGGADAVAPTVESNGELGELLTGLLQTEAPTIDSPIPDAAPLDEPSTVDPALGTEELVELVGEFDGSVRETERAQALLATYAEDVDAAVAALGDRLSDLASSLPAVNQALLASHTLASEESKAAAAAALTALDDSPSHMSLPGLLVAYTTSAFGVVAAHDAEAARIAAEAARVAAERAAKSVRSSSGSGSGGCGTGGGSGVLGYTNAQRAANCVPALAGSATLNSMACEWASQLAAANSGLSHNNTRPPGARTWGENVAAGYSSASAVVSGWMNSSGHRANILNGAYTQMGSCSADAADGTRYWVQKFAG